MEKEFRAFLEKRSADFTPEEKEIAGRILNRLSQSQSMVSQFPGVVVHVRPESSLTEARETLQTTHQQTLKSRLPEGVPFGASDIAAALDAFALGCSMDELKEAIVFNKIAWLKAEDDVEMDAKLKSRILASIEESSLRYQAELRRRISRDESQA